GLLPPQMQAFEHRLRKMVLQKWSVSSNKKRFMKIVSQIFEKFRLISEEAADGTTFIREMGL
ncbi:TPA: hypothetical protein QFM53_002226, partial [Enterococcus faecium]